MKFKKFGDTAEETPGDGLEEKSPEELLSLLLNPGSPGGGEAPRATGIYGDIDQEKCSEAIYSMLCLRESGVQYIENPEDPEGSIIKTYAPFDFHISSWGGSALDMFAVYDVMRMIQKDCDVATYGFGKVMSAGVVLLAAGTKGQRYIGANCRVMIHGVTAGQHGGLHDLENEMNEAKWTQKRYVDALSKESNMTKKEIRELFNRKINVYFDAKQAVEYGIADEII